MDGPIPAVRGPKLHAFPQDINEIKFIRQLDTQHPSSPDHVAHSRVFETVIGKKRYALKVVSPETTENINNTNTV
jgi:hypothetical protein